MTARYPRFRPEIRDWAVRVVRSVARLGGNRRKRIEELADKIGCAPATLATWVREAERADDTKGQNPEQILRALTREVAVLKRANARLKKERDRARQQRCKPGAADNDR